MTARSAGRRRLAFGFALGLFAAAPFAARADDPGAKGRLALMKAAVEALEGKSPDLKPKALAVAPEPLLRYSDPTRGGVKSEAASNVLVDAGVWRLGTEGRPTALVTLEIYKAPDGARVLSYEFLSFTPTKFALKHKTEDVTWDATGSGLELKPLPGAPKPAAAPAARLAQMRQLARRFGAKEVYNKDVVECRLIAQPLDRYSSEEQKITDGAIFALANGTNPEIGIVLECDADRWVYGVARLSSAESTVTLDDKPVATFERFNAYDRRDGPYNSGAHKLPPEK